jgi:hypothetical protein
MTAATIITILVLIVVAVGAALERERRRRKAAEYQAVGLSHTSDGTEPGMPRRGYANTHGYVGGSFGVAGSVGASSGGERVGNENIDQIKR